MATFGTQSSLPTVTDWNATGYGGGKGAGASRMEGGHLSKYDNYEGVTGLHPVSDYMAGISGYISVATDPRYSGQFFNIPELTVTIDGKTVTLRDVPAYAHDTGQAIKGDDVDIHVDWDATQPEMQSVQRGLTDLKTQVTRGLTMERLAPEEFAQRVPGAADLVAQVVRGAPDYPTMASMDIMGVDEDMRVSKNAWTDPYASVGVLNQYGPSLPTPAGAVPPSTSATMDPTLSIRDPSLPMDYGFGSPSLKGTGNFEAMPQQQKLSPVGETIQQAIASALPQSLQDQLSISSGNRGFVDPFTGRTYNSTVPNAAKGSAHLDGDAIDLVGPDAAKTAAIAAAREYAINNGKHMGVGSYKDGSIHIDFSERLRQSPIEVWGEQFMSPAMKSALTAPVEQLKTFYDPLAKPVGPEAIVDLAKQGVVPNTLPAGAATPPAVSNPAAPVPTPPAAAAPAPNLSATPPELLENLFAPSGVGGIRASVPPEEQFAPAAPQQAPSYDPVAAFGGQLAPQAALTEADLSAPQTQPDYPTGPIAPIFDPSTPPPASFGTPPPSSPAVAPPDDFALPMAGPPAQPAYSPTSSTFNPASLGLPETPYAPAAPSTSVPQIAAAGMMAGGGYPMPTARPEAQTLESLPGLESFGRQNMPVDAAAIAAQAKAQTDQQAFGGPAPGLGAMAAAGVAQTAAPLAIGQMATLGMAAPLAAATTIPAGIAQATSKLPDSYNPWSATGMVMNNPGLVSLAGPDKIAEELAKMGAGRAITSGQQAVSNFFTDTVPKGLVSGLTQAQATVDELLGPQFGTPPTPPTVAAPPAPVVTAQQPPALPPVETPPAPAPAPTAPLSASELDDLQLTAFGEAPPSTPAPPATPPAEAPVAAPPPTVAGPLSLEEQLKTGNTTGLPPGVDPGPPAVAAPTTGGSAPSKAAAAATIAAAAAAGAAAPRAAPAAGFGQAPVPVDPRVSQDPVISGMQSPNAPPGYYATEGPTYNAGYGYGVMPTGQWNWATTQLPYTEGMTSQGSWVPAGYEWAGEQAQIAATGSGPFGALADAFGYQY